MPGHPQNPSPSRTWRGQPRSNSAQGTGKQVRRLVMSLLTVALCSALVWLLWWMFWGPRVHLIALPIVDYGVLGVPPVRYSREELDALQQIETRPPVVILQDLQTSPGIVTLAKRLAMRSADTLILYIRGHGVSDNGTAWLLCSDYSPQEQKGRYALHDLLSQIQRCPAKTKLLLVDACHVASDPRLGMVVNEFPRLLKEEVRALKDPSIWVLCSCDRLETSHLHNTARRSAFNYFVTEGLWGKADANGDRWVDLDELFAMVRNGVSGWVHQESGTVESQTPWLINGDVDVDAARTPQQLHLVPVFSRGETPETKEPAAGQSRAADSALRDAKRVRELLSDAWNLCDALQDRTKEPWSPVDYAPHLWREYEELLLGYERRHRAGAAFGAEQLANDLDRDVLSLKKLLQNETATVTAEMIVRRLVDARRQFLENAESQDLASWAKRNSALWEAVRVKNDLLFRAAYYVRWHAAALRLSIRQPQRLYPSLVDLLGQLQTLVDGLAAIEAQKSAEVSPAQLQQIAGTIGPLKDLRQAIEQEGIEKLAKELAETAQLHPNRPGLAEEIDALLSVPLLPGRIRTTLLDACDRPKQPALDAFEAPSDRAEATPTTISTAWQDRLREQVTLQRQLVLLADPAQRLPDIKESADEAQFWKQYREMGRQLGDFYRGLPARIGSPLAATEPAAARERLLRLVDARDAVAVVPATVTEIAVRRIGTVGPPKSRLAVHVEATSPFDAENQGRLNLAVEKEAIPLGRGRIMFQYDPTHLALTSLDGQQSIAPGQWIPVDLRPDRTPLSYAARAVAQTGKETGVQVTIHCGEKSANCLAAMQLPRPDVVDLLVDRVIGTPEGPPAVRQETVRFRPDISPAHRLRPFSNRQTTYRFELVNRSGRKKSLVVQLFALPPGFLGQTMTRQAAATVLENSGGPLGSAAVELPATEEPQKIRFPEPKAPPAEKSAAKPVEPAKPEITHGLALVVRNAKTKQAQGLQCFEFSPLRPKEYLPDPKVTYDTARKTLRVDVQLAKDREIPPISEEKPIVLTLGASHLRSDAAGKKNLAMEIHGKETAKLYPDHLADRLLAEEMELSVDEKVRLELAVDGYPRVFVYDLDPTRDISLERNLRRVRITEPSEGQVYKAPLGKLPVKFQVDAPEDTFSVTGITGSGVSRIRDMVRLEIFDDRSPGSGREERKDFFTDRQTRVRLDEAGPEGEVKVTAGVGDFEIEVDPHGLNNVKARVRAQLKLAKLGDAYSDEHSVVVVLDGQPPEFALAVPSRPVQQGDNVEVGVKVLHELSGIRKIEVGLEGEKPGEFKEKPKLGQPRSETTWAAALPTKELDPGSYTILVRATDLAGNAKFERESVSIVATPPPPAEKTAKVSTIEGQAILQGGGPVSDAQITLQGAGQTATSDAGGKFIFKDVPHGDYWILAKGTAKNMSVSGAAQIHLPGATDPVPVRVELKW